MNPLSIMIASPIDDGHRRCFWESLMDFQRSVFTGETRTVHKFRVYTPPGDSLVPRIRNNILYKWYVEGAEEVLAFVDSDLDFRPSDIVTLANNMAENDRDILCGLYGKKQMELGWVINALRNVPCPIDQGTHRVACGGTGAMLIRRRVIDRMLEKADWWWNDQRQWRIRYKDDNDQSERYHLFSHVVIDDPVEFPHSPRDMSEDWSFCYYARKIGFDVWLDTSTIFMHEGAIQFPLQCRRLTREEVEKGEIMQPDGTVTQFNKPKTENV